MSNYNSLKATIDANIKQNGNQEITGQILNSVLNQMVNILGAGYQFAGVATIATNPGTPDAKVFYIANGKGTYEKFGGINVTEDEVVVLYYDTEWHKVSTGIASQAKLSELEAKVNSQKDIINIPGKYINLNGRITSTTLQNSITDYIPIDCVEKIIIKGRSTDGYVSLYYFYDENKKPISGAHGNDISNVYVTINKSDFPENAKYIILNGFGDERDYLFIFDSSFVSNLNSEVSNLNSEVSNLNSEVSNLIEISSLGWLVNGGKYIRILEGYTGNIVNTTTPHSAVTDYIPIDYIEKITILHGRIGAQVALYAFYDEYKHYISVYNESDSATILKSDFPENAKYIVITGLDDGTTKISLFRISELYSLISSEISNLNKKIPSINISGIMCIGASMISSPNTWFNDGCSILGANAYNKAESGVGTPAYMADKLWRGTLFTEAEFEDSDILVTMFASAGNVYSGGVLKDSYEEYTENFDMADPTNQFTIYDNAQLCDYILKFWQAKCYNQQFVNGSKWYGCLSGKPCLLMFCTHWHDGRVTYNESIRLLAKKWGAILCNFDEKIGFSKSQTINGTQMSVYYAHNDGTEQAPDFNTETKDGVVYGWHPAREAEDGKRGRYIQNKLANIFANCIKDNLSQIVE